MTKLTRRNFSRAVLATAAVTAPSVARAQAKRWRMVTSWPKRLPGRSTAPISPSAIAPYASGRLHRTAQWSRISIKAVLEARDG